MSFTRKQSRDKRKRRIRKRVSGDATCPRLAVFRSNRYLYAQIIDDTQSHTLVAASTTASDSATSKNKDAAVELGQSIAKKASEKGIESVVFDRGGYKYHGSIKSLADAAREAGLRF